MRTKHEAASACLPWANASRHAATSGCGRPRPSALGHPEGVGLRDCNAGRVQVWGRIDGPRGQNREQRRYGNGPALREVSYTLHFLLYVYHPVRSARRLSLPYTMQYDAPLHPSAYCAVLLHVRVAYVHGVYVRRCDAMCYYSTWLDIGTLSKQI